MMPAEQDGRFDVVVVGGGAAGVGAAIGAARAGARVALVERYGFLGGAATNANVLTYCGLFVAGERAVPAIGGVGADIVARLGAAGVDVAPFRAPSGNWIVLFDPETLKFVLDEAVAAAGVVPLLHAQITGAVAEDGAVRAVRMTDHAGTREIAARAFVDASGEGDLAHLAGCTAAVDAARGDHVQSASVPMRIGGLPPDVMPERAALAAATEAGGGRIGGGSFFRHPGTDEAWWLCIDLPTDGLTTESLTRAEIEGRRIANACVAALRRQPGLERLHLIGTGPQLGIRETRRPLPRLTLTRADGLAGRRSADGIARAAWPMEVHEAPGKPVFEKVGGEGFFDVPLDALRAAERVNLWLGGRVIGADTAAYGSIRVMGTGFATGQAAGVAAALQAGGGAADAAAARAVLEGQGALI